MEGASREIIRCERGILARYKLVVGGGGMIITNLCFDSGQFTFCFIYLLMQYRNYSNTTIHWIFYSAMCLIVQRLCCFCPTIHWKILFCSLFQIRFYFFGNNKYKKLFKFYLEYLTNITCSINLVNIRKSSWIIARKIRREYAI